MALSMTGCGEGVAVSGGSTCRIELRGVNNKHFKLSLRTRDAVALLEPRVEAAVRVRVKRGTIHAAIDLAGAAATPARRLDKRQLAAYLDDLNDFCATHDLPLPRAADALLGLPGILLEEQTDGTAAERLWPLVAEALDVALDRFDRMRQAEGAALAADMRGCCGEIARLCQVIAARVPEVVTSHRDRLRERVGKLLADRSAAVADADLAREVALLADRTDVAEELVRLASHVTQFDRLLDEASPGRALDFLAQEMAREANTIASKSLDVSIAHAVVEIKTRIERLREQAQNIE
jgi:uncharacterized protein (TIGR00255 family)